MKRTYEIPLENVTHVFWIAWEQLLPSWLAAPDLPPTDSGAVLCPLPCLDFSQAGCVVSEIKTV